MMKKKSLLIKRNRLPELDILQNNHTIGQFKNKILHSFYDFEASIKNRFENTIQIATTNNEWKLKTSKVQH